MNDRTISRLLGGAHNCLGLLHRLDDVGIDRAAADVPAHVFADFSVGAGVTFAHTGDGGENLARCAVAALERVVIDEGLLHGMQRPPARREALDGRDRTPLRCYRERQARQHPTSCDQDRAGTALAMVAALLRSREVEMIAQRVEQRRADVERQTMAAAVDVERDHHPDAWRYGWRGSAGRRSPGTTFSFWHGRNARTNALPTPEEARIRLVADRECQRSTSS